MKHGQIGRKASERNACRETMQAEWALLFVHSPGLEPEAGGVFLLDLSDQKLHFKLKSKLKSTDLTVLEVWQDMAAELQNRIADYGGGGVLEWLETTASNLFQLGDRHRIPIRDGDLQGALDELYSKTILK